MKKSQSFSKRIFNRSLIILFLIMNPYAAFCTENAKLNITLRDNNKDTVKLNINGGFIELLLDYTNGFMGMWAQEFEDRGFDNNTCENNLCNWKSMNNNQISLIDGGFNANGKHYIDLQSKNNDTSGIEQNVILTDKTSHDFYIYAKKNVNANPNLFISIKDNDDKTLFSNTIEITSKTWEKYSLKIPVISNLSKCTVQIFATNSDSVSIDEASLMPSNNINGLRAEYANNFSYWKPTVMRYPGGWFADCKAANWKNCLYPIDNRISPNFTIGTSNQRLDMGFDEFMRICEVFNIQAHITVNYENGTPEEAAEWVEYANGDTNTTFGKLRAQNGHPMPYAIKYWEVGNEQYSKPAEYAQRYVDFYNSMKNRDSSISIIIDGNHWDGNSFDNLIGIAGEKCDIFGYHPMKGIPKSKKGSDRDKFLAMIGNDNIESNVIVKYANKIATSKNPRMLQAITEWWASNGIGENDWLLDTNARNRSLETGLWNAIETMIFYRNSKYIDFATRTIGIGLFGREINSKNEKVFFPYPTLHSMAMLRNHIGKYISPTEIECNKYHVDELDIWTSETKWLEALTTFDKDSVFIAVVNRHPEESLQTEIKINDIQYTGKNSIAYTLTSNHYLDNNSADNPEKILPTQSSFMFNGSYSFPKHSLTVLAIPRDGISAVSPSPDDTHDFNVYPNPASEILCISKTNVFDTITRVNIINQLGLYVNDIIQTDNDSSLYLNIETLPKGVYYLEIHYDNKKVIKKFVKI